MPPPRLTKDRPKKSVRAAPSARTRARAHETASTKVDEVDGPRTEGHRRLLLLADSLSAIGAELGVSKQAISVWRKGRKMPSPEQRAKLQAKYKIPADSWDVAPGVELASAPADLDEAPAVLGPRHDTRAELVSSLAALNVELERPGLTGQVRRSLLSDKIRVVTALDKREKDREMLEDRIVKEHPFWAQIRSSIVGALLPYPEAARAVADALLRLEA